MIHRIDFWTAFVLALCCTAPSASAGEESFLVLASTTSTEASGFFDFVLPRFQRATGIAVRVVAVGTGQAIRLARAGDADALLVHDRASEERFVADGYGIARHEVMYNDFVIVGPRADPAGIGKGGAASADAAVALAKIADARAAFVSRADDSGTHKAEERLWRAAGRDPRAHSGRWYRETGSGMGRTLNTASAMEAYTLVDRGTWLSFRNRGGLVLLVEGDERLFNPYGAIVVSDVRHPHVRIAAARRFVQWLISPEGQGAIGDFRVAGERLFHPTADLAP